MASFRKTSSSTTTALLERRRAPPSYIPPSLVAPQVPFHLMESIFSFLPTLDLLSAAAVSTTWRRAALSSPRHRPPSLLLHTHVLRHLKNPLSPSSTTSTSVLDDPNFANWIHLPPFPSPPFPIRSSTSDHLLYTFSASQLSFSSDPLHLRWTHLPSPTIWRVDPIVALVDTVIVAGGVSEYEDDPLAVEIFNDGKWIPAHSMPDAFRRSASASHLSAAVAGGKLHVVDRESGLTSSFDPLIDKWTEPIELLPAVQPRPFTFAVAAAGDKLVVAGVMGRPSEVTGVKLWNVSGEMVAVDIGEMPEDMVGRFARGPEMDSFAGVSAVEVRAAEAGKYIYVYNPSEIGEAFYHTAEGVAKGREWVGVATGVERAWTPTETVVVTCSAVSMDEIREALRRGRSPRIVG